ncbi:MAG TPA: metallophosphoesterase [Elusimicrobiales bacterium]|nr:metallophosphoesterase [Elusimicrobiales bacterium]
MLRIIHAADLHLSSGPDKEYGLEVLRELIGLANARQADFLLLCGDIFDSFKDLKDISLLNALRVETQLLRKDCRALYIPGNHEALGLGPRDKLSNIKFSRLELAVDEASPFGGITVETPDAEFICVPHAADYSGYRKWDLPAKAPGRARVLLMHGTSSAVYRGPDQEEQQAGIIPDSLFAWTEADYAALGHVHSARETLIGGTAAVYCGSARVWRKWEEGPRKAVYFEIEGGKIGPREDLPLKAAGEFRSFTLPVDPDSSVPPAAMQDLLDKCRAPYRDYLLLNFSGLVEDANALAELKLVVESVVKAKNPRKLEIVSGEVESYGGLAGNGLAKEFLEQLDARRPPEGSPEMPVWLAARQQGLAALAGDLE